MLAVDTSVVIAAFAVWHDGHRAALAALDRRPRLPAHVLLEELFGVDALPTAAQDVARDRDVVSRYVVRRPSARPAAGRLQESRRIGGQGGLAGGSIYDAVIAWTAKRAGATLLTRDRRAVRVYEAVGAPFDLIL